MTKLTLPTIPREHEVRFRNKFERVKAFLCWSYELDEIAMDSDNPLRSQARSMLATAKEREFALAFFKLVRHNMVYVRHFETQTKSQVCYAYMKTPFK